MLGADDCRRPLAPAFRYRACMAQIRQSRQDSGLGLQVKVLKPLKLFPLRSEAVKNFLNFL